MDQKLLGILGGKTERYPYNLESKYPRVFEKIMLLWDSPEINDYFMGLMVTDRHDRAGFPPDVASEILYLTVVHASHRPTDKKQDVWDASARIADFVPRSFLKEAADWIPPPDTIRNAIQTSGIPCSPEGFLRAVAAGNVPVVDLFLKAQVNTETRDEHGWTSLILAVFNGRDAVAGLLIQYGAHVNAADFDGNTALHHAALAGHIAAAKLLIENHAGVNLCNSSGLTPLIQATARRHLKMVQLLISSGANLDAAARDGWTALHKAAALGCSEIVWPLLRNGANINIKNLDGDTPIKLAIKNKQSEVIQIFISASGTDSTAT